MFKKSNMISRNGVSHFKNLLIFNSLAYGMNMD